MTKATLDGKRSAIDIILFIGVLLVFVSEYLSLDTISPALKATRIGTLIPIATFMLWFVLGRRASQPALQTRLLLALAAIMMLSVLYALVGTRAFLAFKQFTGYLLLYFLLVHIIDSQKRLSLLLFTLVAVHLTIILLNPQIFSHETRSGSLKAGYFLGDGNDFSISLVIMVPMAAMLAFKAQRWLWKGFSFSAMLAFIAAIVGLGSRASALSLGAMALMFLISSKRKLPAIVLLSLFAIGIVAFASQSFFERVESIGQYQQDTSSMGRINAWKAGLQMSLTHPLGVGAGNFNSYYGRFMITPDAPSRNRWISPHSTYIQCLTELGYPGLGILVWLLLTNVKMVRRNQKVEPLSKSESLQSAKTLSFVLELGIVGYMVNAAFLGTLYYPHLIVLSGFSVISANLISLAQSSADLVGNMSKRNITANRASRNLPEKHLSDFTPQTP